MGYTGKAPGSYWLWRPSQAAIQDQWMTLVTEFESGVEQRRGKWDRPRLSVRFSYSRGALNHDDLADIWRFYNSQKGALYTFEAPTYGALTTVASAYAGSGVALGVSDSRDFTTSTTSRWRRIWAENALGGYEAWAVNSVVSTTQINIATGAASATVLAVGDPIYPLVTVRFAQAIHSMEYMAALLGSVGVELLEVR